MTITIDRKMSQSEADALVGAFRTGGAAALRKGLAGIAPTGTIRIGAGVVTPTRFTIERPTGEGRLLTIRMNQGAFVVEDDAVEVVRLTGVKKTK